MSASFVLSCLFWIASEPIKVVQMPVSEYGMATIEEQFAGFQFSADVIEEKMNSVRIRHLASETEAMGYTYEWPQKSLVVKLNTKGKQASAECEIK